MQPSEFCGLLNKYAKANVPDLRLEFLPNAGQPLVGVAHICLEADVAIGIKENYQSVFQKRVEAALSEISKMCSNITSKNPKEKKIV